MKTAAKRGRRPIAIKVKQARRSCVLDETASIQVAVNPGSTGLLVIPVKPAKTMQQPKIESSFRNNRRCKNTAVRGAGQAGTTICSILLTLRCTIFGNTRVLLCKTGKGASKGSFKAKGSSALPKNPGTSPAAPAPESSPESNPGASQHPLRD
jgi:hypothetical protein